MRKTEPLPIQIRWQNDIYRDSATGFVLSVPFKSNVSEIFEDSATTNYKFCKCTLSDPPVSYIGHLKGRPIAFHVEEAYSDFSLKFVKPYIRNLKYFHDSGGTSFLWFRSRYNGKAFLLDFESILDMKKNYSEIVPESFFAYNGYPVNHFDYLPALEVLWAKNE